MADRGVNLVSHLHQQTASQYNTASDCKTFMGDCHVCGWNDVSLRALIQALAAKLDVPPPLPTSQQGDLNVSEVRFLINNVGAMIDHRCTASIVGSASASAGGSPMKPTLPQPGTA